MTTGRKGLALGAILGLVAIGLAISAGGSLLQKSPESWRDHYGVDPRPAITEDELMFIDFIPGFGSGTIDDLEAAVPIASEADLRSVPGLGAVKEGILLALYSFDGSGGSDDDPADASRFFTVPARVTEIVDGDTFDVRWPDGTTERVRPAGMDTPETPDECFATEAEDFTETVLLGRTVWLAQAPDGPRDRFDRLLARVHLDSSEMSSFNKLMVSQGFAVADERFPVGAELQPLEDEARDAGRGLWEACR